jgi:hypothetical protein
MAGNYQESRRLLEPARELVANLASDPRPAVAKAAADVLARW